MDRGSQLDKEDEADEEAEDEEEKEKEKEREEEEKRKAADIKSNNPHLAGGEKNILKHFMTALSTSAPSLFSIGTMWHFFAEHLYAY